MQLHMQPADITAENSSLRISGVVHEVMRVTSLNSPRADDRPRCGNCFVRHWKRVGTAL